MQYEISDLSEIDLSFITNQETQRQAEECIASLAHTQQYLADARAIMQQIDAQLARVGSLFGQVKTIPPVTQRPLSWCLEEWIPPEDLSPEACYKRFEEVWNGPAGK
jgi:hypothetical protein